MTWLAELASQIRSARESRGYTQEQLATAIGRSRNMVVRYEAAKDVPNVDVFARIAAELELREVTLNGYRVFVVKRDLGPRLPPAEQFTLEFDKEYTYPAAVVKIRPTKAEIIITAEVRNNQTR